MSLVSHDSTEKNIVSFISKITVLLILLYYRHGAKPDRDCVLETRGIDLVGTTAVHETT